jgi:hypothetical protein
MSLERKIVRSPPPVFPAIKKQDEENASCEESVGINNVNPSDADGFYTFLRTRTVVQLRARLQELGQPQKGEKSALALRVFGKVVAVVGEDGNWITEGGAEYKEWACFPEGQLTSRKVAPSAAEYSGVALRASELSATRAAFSVSEFERMCYI